MDSSIVVALIGGGATIIAAVVTAVLQRARSSPPSPLSPDPPVQPVDKDPENKVACPPRMLTEAEKAAIRRRIEEGQRDSNLLAEEFKCGPMQIAGIKADIAKKNQVDVNDPKNGQCPLRTLTEEEKTEIHKRIAEGQSDYQLLAQKFRCGPMQIAGIKADITKKKGGT